MTKTDENQSIVVPEKRMLALLVCPRAQGVLSYDAEANELISLKARLAYPIREGIPIMLPDEARAF